MTDETEKTIKEISYLIRGMDGGLCTKLIGKIIKYAKLKQEQGKKDTIKKADKLFIELRNFIDKKQFYLDNSHKEDSYLVIEGIWLFEKIRDLRKELMKDDTQKKT